jgi:hypothetical protein
MIEISEETRAILLRLYALHDQIALNVIKAVCDGIYVTGTAGSEALDETDRLCDQVEKVFGEYLTEAERGSETDD